MRLLKPHVEPSETDEEHDRVDKQLEEHEKRLRNYATRLRRLELEHGIFEVPPIKGVEN